MVTPWKKPFLPIVTALGRRIERRRFSEPPVFIGGCGRSGTTVLLSVLSAHREIFACPKELGLFDAVVEDASGRRLPARIDRLYTCLLTHRIARHARRWCEKSPSNIHHVDDIDRYTHGNFRFIQIVRDGRDVVLSHHPGAPHRPWVPPHRWVKDVGAGLQHAQRDQVHTIRYEDLVREFETTLRGICGFLEIEFSDEIRNWRTSAAVTRNRAYRDGLQPLHARSIGKWRGRTGEEAVAELMENERARELLQVYGYLS